MSVPGQPTHNRKYSDFGAAQVRQMRAAGRSYGQIAYALGMTYSTVARMARGEWGAKTAPRLVACKFGCGKMLARKTKKEGAACGPCRQKQRTRRSCMYRRYAAMRDLFGFEDQEFEKFMLLARRTMRCGEDLVIQVLVQDLKEERP